MMKITPCQAYISVMLSGSTDSVAILAQGTSWAVADTQAFLQPVAVRF